MQEINYVGEWLLPGNLGRFLVISGLVSSLAATIAYFISANKSELAQAETWKKLGRWFYTYHAIAVVGIMAVLFYLIFNHRYEYYYVWQHSSDDLPLRYIFSCFWEGQEGSFLLWTIWHALLGFFFMRKSQGKWEAPVLAVFGITQAFLLSMIIGLYIGDYKIGSNPFALLRNSLEAPIFSSPNYLSFIEDGNGLNPLLQNYWMTIHPPTLFLGFATTLIPFAYVIASMWKKDYTGWVERSLPWVIFSTMILGVGILMGGAWAYESLTFGGFWAWDPVENASLVPWLTLVAGLHTLVAYRSSKHGLIATFVLFVATFLLILYSTFLTRSGVLGESSVHSFTDLGMSGQLLVFMLFYVVLSIVLLAINWKSVPSPKTEENTSSREFWMFIGALVFSLSAIHIIVSTSSPVFNKIVNGFYGLFNIDSEVNFAPDTDLIAYYNKWQVWFAVVVALLSAMVQYMRYKKSDWQKFGRSLLLSAGIALALSIVFIWALEIWHIAYMVLMVASVFAVVANANYIFSGLKGKLKVSGGSISHIGFGLMLVGILISNYKQQVISVNTTIDYGEAFDEKSARENILLRLNDPINMYGYTVTYVGDTLIEPNTYYRVNYLKTDANGDTTELFQLTPNAQINPAMGIVANPDTRHYLTRDIYTHVTSVPDRDAEETAVDSFIERTVTLGDTFFLSTTYAVIEGVNPKPEYEDKQEGDIAFGLRIKLFNPTAGAEYTAEPIFLIRRQSIESLPFDLPELGLKLRVENVIPEKDEFVLGVAETETAEDFIIMKAIMFPYINVLWLGILIMVAGMVLSIVQRQGDKKRLVARE